MDHGETESLAVVQNRLVAKPEQEFLAVGGVEDLGNRILLADLDSPGGHGQEVQIVVAEYANSGGAEAAHEAQQLQRVGSLVDEIPGKPETVDIRVEVKLLQKPQQVIKAPLDVADGIGGPHTLVRLPALWQIEVHFRSVGCILHSGVPPVRFG